MQSLNSLGLNFEFEKRYSQTLMPNTTIVNVIDSNILMHMCQNGWMNKKKMWARHVKLQIGNECNFILNLSYSLRADHERNKIVPIFDKNEKLKFKMIANFVGLDE